MNRQRFQALIVGVGGQGVLTAARILGDAAEAAQIPAVVGQLHGMSQRGGSVECSLILGEAEASFIYGDNVDVLIAYEPLEALRALSRVGPATRVLLNTATTLPFEAVTGESAYPNVDEILQRLGQTSRSVHAFDATRLLGRVGEKRALNVLLLGAAAALELFPIPSALLLAAALSRGHERFCDANRRAFELGRESVRGPGDHCHTAELERDRNLP